MDLRGTYLTGKQITKKILLVFSNGDQRTFLHITSVCVCVCVALIVLILQPA